jgi:GDP-L-fucose synthase
LSNKPEPTNEGFALSKIMSLKLSQYYSNQYGLKTLNLIASNLYGTNDHYDLENSHVLSALIKKFVDADRMGLKEVKLWGSGKPIREFMHVDDFAEALFFLIKNWESNNFINVGSGEEISIKNLAELIINKTGYKGSVLWDYSKKDGMIRKCLDISSLKKLNYKHNISISEGIVKTINEYKKQIEL